MQRDAACGELAAHESEHLAAAACHLVGGVDVREPGEAARGHVPVRGVHDDLERGRRRLVRVPLRRPGHGGAGVGLGQQAALDEAVHEREQGAQPVPRRPDAVGTHQRRVETRDVGLDHPVRDAGCEQVQRRSAVRGAVALFVGGKRCAGPQIGAHEQRIDDAGRGARIGEPLVPSRHHARQRVRRAAEHAGQGSDFLHVVGGVPANAIGVGAIRGVDLAARDVDTSRARDPEVFGDRLEAMPRQLAGREVVAANGVERVDQLAARRDEADAPLPRSPIAPVRQIALGHAMAGRAHPQTRAPRAAERDGNAKDAGAPVEERQVEAVQVVVLDHIRIRIADTRDQRADEIRFASIAIIP